jgi:hypothetical protein
MQLLNKKALFFALLLLFSWQFATSQVSSFKDSLLGQTNTITTAVPFLQIGPDTRAGGMGDYGAATTPDANSIHWNVSKLAFIEKKGGISISYTPWLSALVNDISLAYVSGYKKLKNDQAIAGSLRYFSLGNIDFTNELGDQYASFNPNEWAIDVAYARKLGEKISGGLALRYIYSNLTGGVAISNGTVNTHAGTSIAADLSTYYRTDLEISKKDALLAFGLNISNIGAKVSYTDTQNKDFIPTNFRLGANLKIELDQYNTIAFGADINKLLVPTPPVYAKDSTGNYVIDAEGNKVIEAGKDPNISVPAALFSSWTDAPAGFEEEMKEFIYTIGFEYWYDNQFSIRTGYFHEAATKGNRQYFTVGAGIRYNVFGFDFAYLIPTTQRNPLENTLRFTLLFDFAGLKKDGGDNGGDESE